jgi:hypothetical protein
MLRGGIGRCPEFVRTADLLSFASPKESKQRKGDPCLAPAGFPHSGQIMRPAWNSLRSDSQAGNPRMIPPAFGEPEGDTECLRHSPLTPALSHQGRGRQPNGRNIVVCTPRPLRERGGGEGRTAKLSRIPSEPLSGKYLRRGSPARLSRSGPAAVNAWNEGTGAAGGEEGTFLWFLSCRITRKNAPVRARPDIGS